MYKIDFDTPCRIHFIGIGGISMSGFAEYLHTLGFKVSGSDSHYSKITDHLEELGIQVYLGQKPSNISSDIDVVVYTAAIAADNEEFLEVKRQGIPMLSRVEMIGQVMLNFENAVAVSGTHGKTTTTSLIAIIMNNANLDPTIMVGGEVDALGGNVRPGSSPYFVTEACEYVESFLKLYPYIGIILNVDADHLDYYSGLDHIIQSFTKFVELIPDDGYLIVCSDDDNTMKASSARKSNVITFGLKDGARWMARNVRYDSSGCGIFDVYDNGQFFGSFKLNIPGEHNVKNALCAIACSQIFNISKDIIYSSLAEFYGTHRRFENKGNFNGVTVIDDYAHHPTEVKATLSAVKNYPHKKLWCIFQPHTYTRTIKLFDEFSSAFNDTDELILTDIYAAREKDTGEINSSMLCDSIKKHGVNAKYISPFEDIVKYIRENASSGDVVITMGAGDVYNIGEILIK
jgi:UDP-N-acetylmuramate--alanine ligase